MVIYARCRICQGIHRFSRRPKLFYKCKGLTIPFSELEIISEWTYKKNQNADEFVEIEFEEGVDKNEA